VQRNSVDFSNAETIKICAKVLSVYSITNPLHWFYFLSPFYFLIGVPHRAICWSRRCLATESWCYWVSFFICCDQTSKELLSIFQESAGIFTYIKDRIVSVAGEQQPTADLTPDILNALKVTMVAQAQECFYDKASSDPSRTFWIITAAFLAQSSAMIRIRLLVTAVCCTPYKIGWTVVCNALEPECYSW